MIYMFLSMVTVRFPDDPDYFLAVLNPTKKKTAERKYYCTLSINSMYTSRLLHDLKNFSSQLSN